METVQGRDDSSGEVCAAVIYVCIPVHEEAGTVGVLLWKIRKVMAELVRDYEILVFDDASADDTAATLERYRKVLPLTVLRSEERLGYARALEGLLREVTRRAAYPKRDMAITLQGDFTDDPAHLSVLVKTIEGGADVVAGYATRRGGGPRSVRWARSLAPVGLGRALSSCPRVGSTVRFSRLPRDRAQEGAQGRGGGSAVFYRGLGDERGVARSGGTACAAHRGSAYRATLRPSDETEPSAVLRSSQGVVSRSGSALVPGR